jgi:uncharacterized membrane protein YedE/YeeE
MSVARSTVALCAGIIFGFGLAFSGMMDPGRVQSFLDVTGPWSANLAFVLAGAVMVAFVGVRISKRMTHPVLDDEFHVSTKSIIDAPLVIGAAMFGVGWGLAGFCPGPAVASLSLGVSGVWVFVAAMVIGMVVHDQWRASHKGADKSL